MKEASSSAAKQSEEAGAEMEDVKLDETKDNGRLPPNVEDMRTRVTLLDDAPTNTQTFSYSGAFKNLGYDNSFDFKHFQRNFGIKIMSLNDEELVFDMWGIEAPIANAFRRILLSEVPTIAIEKVIVSNNTSIIQDEVLAHRLGLVPIKVDPRLFEFKQPNAPDTERDTLLFRLQVKCTHSPSRDGKYINESVYSGDLKWQPIGNQAQTFKDNPPRPVHDNILLAKMRPGQEINLECYCEKGIGKTHAKWSPVATAYYRLLPQISFSQDGGIVGDEAKQLKQMCPKNVFDIEDIGGQKHATVARPRDCTFCRECIRLPDWENKVKLQKVKDHFIFTVESTGILKPEELFRMALQVFMDKCRNILSHLHDAAQ